MLPAFVSGAADALAPTAVPAAAATEAATRGCASAEAVPSTRRAAAAAATTTPARLPACRTPARLPACRTPTAAAAAVGVSACSSLDGASGDRRRRPRARNRGEFCRATRTQPHLHVGSVYSSNGAAAAARGRGLGRAVGASRPASLALAASSADASAPAGPRADRNSTVRIAIPSKGDIGKATLDLLRECGLEVDVRNPRQYVASLRGFDDVELWFQRPPDIVRKVKEGTLDLGVAGTDLVAEFGGSANELISVFPNLGFGACRLGFGVPILWTDTECADDLRQRVESMDAPLRIVTKFPQQAEAFLHQTGITRYELIYMDGALEAAIQLGTADCIIDLISSGVTLRENNLKELRDGTILHSNMELIANRTHLAGAPHGRRLRQITRELVERLDAHFVARNHFNVIANIRGDSAGDVARRLGEHTDLLGMDGPTISSVVPPRGVEYGLFAIGVVVRKDRLYTSMRQLRRAGGSGVCVLPVQYVFESNSVRWRTLCERLGVRADEDEVDADDDAPRRRGGAAPNSDADGGARNTSDGGARHNAATESAATRDAR